MEDILINIAVIGTGISGLMSAYLLQRAHTLEVFEANDYIGGHTNTITVPEGGRAVPVDTGFIVYNTATYPGLTRLFAELNVPSQESSMTFSLSCRATGLEFGSEALFAQTRNLFRPAYWRMLLEHVRFGREAEAALTDPHYARHTLGQFTQERKYSKDFVRYFVVPAASAIWSSPHAAIYDFPAQAFFRFYKNHGLLGVGNYLKWRTVTGGSQVYVQKLTAGFRDRIHLNSPVRAIQRCESGVTLRLADDTERHFDQVVIATHSDQALRLLADPSPTEQAVLGGLPYQPNTAVLHTDPSVMPRRRAAWSAWNYTLYTRSGHDQPAALTYWMNALQSLEATQNYFVTINPAEPIDPAHIIRTIPYAHPLYTLASFEARQRLPEINGQRHTHFCGAYFTYGFHEDGLQSGVRVAEALGVHWPQPQPVTHSLGHPNPVLELVAPERLSPAQ